MSDTSQAPNEAQNQPASSGSSMPSSVIIRPWPKVVLLYPSLLVALFCFIWQWVQAPDLAKAAADAAEAAAGAGVDADPDVFYGSPFLGNLFMIVFFANLLVFSFDFSRIKTITLIVLVLAAILGLGWADSEWGISSGISDVGGWIDNRMNTQFYGFMSGFLTIVMIVVLINTRFNYYEVNHREILHHQGYLGDITRMPTSGLRLNKEIYDLFEFLLLRSGRLIFYPSTSREAIVIDNVINVNKVESRIKDLLSVVAVRVHGETH